MSHEHDNLILDIENLVVRYETEDGIVHALNGIDLQLGYHQTIGLVGETGAGKTTAALAMMRLVPSPPGVVECDKLMVDGRDILNLPTAKMEEVRGKDVSMIFQDPMTALNPVFTVGEQIAESLELHEHLDKKAAMERAKEMLELVGIPGSRANEYPHQFSGGMKQRVVIAIALACNPKLLIADEPTTALDVTIQAQVLELMSELKEKYDTSMILITHDLGIVAEVCDTVAVMYAGRIVEQGTLEDVFDHTKHPYTEGLFNSLPNIQNRTAMLKPIKGLMVFTDLAADAVVSGGQTMNPSTEDILAAIQSVPAKTVFVLPNNKNIIMAAEQAEKLADRQVVVLPTRTVPMGITAMLNFDPSVNAETNTINMMAAADKVSTGLITYAARDSEYDGKRIKKGEIMALENGKIVATSTDITKATYRLARGMCKKDSCFVTIISGCDVSDEDAEKVTEMVKAKCPNHVEVSHIRGGQPVYYYMISVE